MLKKGIAKISAKLNEKVAFLKIDVQVICEWYGNPSSMHKAGREVRSVVEGACQQVADIC